jgi:hypothetical protein
MPNFLYEAAFLVGCCCSNPATHVYCIFSCADRAYGGDFGPTSGTQDKQFCINGLVCGPPAVLWMIDPTRFEPEHMLLSKTSQPLK